MSTSSTRAQQITGLAAAAAASVSLGVVTPAARIAYDGGVSATTLVAFRVAVAVVITAVLVAVLRRPWAFNPDALKPALSTTLGILMVAFGYMSSVLFIPVSLSALIFFTFPIIVLVHATWAERRAPARHHERLRRRVRGAWLGPRTELRRPGLAWRGLRPGRRRRRLPGHDRRRDGGAAHGRPDALTLTFYTQAFCLPVVFGVGAIAPPTGGTEWIGLNIAAAGYIGGMCLLMLAVRFANPAPVSMINNLEPLVTLAAAALILGERMSLVQYTGGGLVLVAVVLATREMTPKDET